MDKNPICTEMKWPVPGECERLDIIHDGRLVGTLTAARDGVYEGVYSPPAYGVPNACLSSTYGDTPVRIRAKLAAKLFANGRNLKKGELASLRERLDHVTVHVREMEG